ncbi:response regulator, partial [Desulfosarcina sp.]|nr:response regulator [Desulfosarcina sp.]
MLRTIIIDDEAHMRQTLEKMVDQFCSNLKLVASADGVESGVAEIRKHHPDLILLDIKMNDGTGFDLLKELEPIDFKIIFITAYDQYAIKAIKFSAIDYLLKPIDPDELKLAALRADEIVQRDFNIQLNAL